MSARLDSAVGEPPQAPPFGGPGCERPWRILELFARNAGLEEILAESLLLIAEREAVHNCAVVAPREGRFRCLAASGVARDLLDEIGEAGTADAAAAPFWDAPAGFVGFSAARGWEAWRRPAEAAGLRGCWAEPILSAAGELLGHALAFAESPVPGASAPEGLRLTARIAGVAMDRCHLIADLLYHSHHDAVTLLPNRYLLEERLAAAMTGADRAGTGVALLQIDLDRFQTVNDLLGSSVGDLLLQQVARRLETALAPADTLARTAGDEFSAVLPGIGNLDHALRSAERLCARLAAPFAVNEHELTVTASVGCALYPEQAPDAVSLEQSAGAALQRAKHAGRNCVRGFIPGEAGAARQKARLESALSQALARSEFRLAYQPQVILRTMELSGTEALLRWHHPVIGTVSPAAFIPIAEETGLILPVGRWVLREGCRQAAAWRRLGMRGRVAVNVSPLQLGQDDFVAFVEAVLAESRVPPDAIEIELTETALAQDIPGVARKMRELKSLGISLAVDDFGTGYSSLAHLQDLPVDILKIDISFVRRIAAEEDRSPVIETIVAMTHALGKRLVAEGVETLAQQAYLTALGCDAAQGFLYGRPAAPADLAARWLR
jgi:diguanylate cyclase (GGDEF)-like protein